jgi:hypothetical protein
MALLDKYDILGLVLVGLLATLWIAHFVFSAPPLLAP